jgi:hypothetical protein
LRFGLSLEADRKSSILGSISSIIRTIAGHNKYTTHVQRDANILAHNLPSFLLLGNPGNIL